MKVIEEHYWQTGHVQLTGVSRFTYRTLHIPINFYFPPNNECEIKDHFGVNAGQYT